VNGRSLGQSYYSEDSFDSSISSPYSSFAMPQENSLRTAKYSMSMSAISSVANAYPATSSTYEQYFSNIDESGEDQGGIFF
jgi:hypothetical protein